MARIKSSPAPGQVSRRSFDDTDSIPVLGVDQRVTSRNLDPYGYGGMARRADIQRELFRPLDSPAKFRERVALPDVKLSGLKAGYGKGPAASKAASKAKTSVPMGLMGKYSPMRTSASKAAKATPKTVKGPGASMAAAKASAMAKSKAAPNSAVHGPKMGSPTRYGPSIGKPTPMGSKSSSKSSPSGGLGGRSTGSSGRSGGTSSRGADGPSGVGRGRK
jgi:hypothetical protein